MGLAFSGLWQRMFCKGDRRILMVGLDAAGKTTILYKLKLGEIVTTIPTIGSVVLCHCASLTPKSWTAKEGELGRWVLNDLGNNICAQCPRHKVQRRDR